MTAISVTPRSGKYARQRPKVAPPLLSLAVLRQATGRTLEDVAARVEHFRPDQRVSRGTLSAIENGHRGVSADMLAALELAYGIAPGSLTTDYAPRATVGDREPQ